MYECKLKNSHFGETGEGFGQKGFKGRKNEAMIFSFAVNITYNMGLKPLDGYMERDYGRRWVIMIVK
jgi:hypothetical protein